jgi:hypothetical protein
MIWSFEIFSFLFSANYQFLRVTIFYLLYFYSSADRLNGSSTFKFIQKHWLSFGQPLCSFSMKLDHFPRTCPDTFFAVRTSFLYDRNTRFHQLNRIFRTDTDTAAAIVTLPGDNMNHQWSISWHICAHNIFFSFSRLFNN